MDIMSLLHPHPEEVFTGTYYRSMPGIVIAGQEEAAPVPFDYEIIDPTEWHYQRLFSNVVVKDSLSCAIKTCDNVGFQVGGYIVTQDGAFYMIISVQEDVRTAKKQAFRLFDKVPGVEYVMRLSEKENPWGIK